MSNDTPQYILRKPFQISFHVTEDEPADPNFIDTPFQMFSAKAFDHFFVEVDMVQLRKQIEQIVKDACENAFMRGADYGRETTTENFKRYYDLEKAHEIAGSASERLVGLLTQGSEIQ